MHTHGNQIKTLNLQISYDTKLKNATYDALKAFQLNTVNSGSSDLANSKLRDIEASANTFFNSIASNFNMVGYNKEILSDYVPALVYTMYDGYYIYSNYTNTLDRTNQNIDPTDPNNVRSDADILDENSDATYKNGDILSGLKPYIFYSCRYQYDGSDFVITYSLDNYITIQGIINDKGVFDCGYVITPDNVRIESTGEVYYRDVEIKKDEILEEYIWDQDADNGSGGKGAVKKYPYKKVNGVKYYYDDLGAKWFTILNGEKLEMKSEVGMGSPPDMSSTSAVEYYKEAKAFTERLLNEYGLGGLKGSDARDEMGNSIAELDEKGNRLVDAIGRPIVYKLGTYEIFSGTTDLEDPNSNFNQQRLAVIRNSIERNLYMAIQNYDPAGTTEFRMPKLKEDEWDKIVNNVSIISFLQGLNIGGKIYNGYSIITNNKNEEVVHEDSIYILDTDNNYHKANHRDIDDSKVKEGIFNIDLERKSVSTRRCHEICYTKTVEHLVEMLY